MFPGNQRKGSGVGREGDCRATPNRDGKPVSSSEAKKPGLLQITPTPGARGKTRERRRRSSGSFPGAQRRDDSSSKRRGSSLSVGSKEEAEREGGDERAVGAGMGPPRPRGLLEVEHITTTSDLSKRKGISPVYPHPRRDLCPSASREQAMRIQASDVVVKGRDPNGVADWLAKLSRSEAQMKRALSQWVGGRSDKLDRIGHICAGLQVACENLILLDLEFSSKKEVGARLWRSAHYPVIETLRKQLISSSHKDSQARESLLQFLEDTVSFYSQLVESIQRVYQFQLSALLSGNTQFQSRTHHRTVMMAAFTCQWCYLYLGDVSRYQEQLVEKSNWAKPRAFYLKAQQLAPKDGKPYSRLAIVAINAHRRLDAVYYYMRSLTAKNPFQSAHESLVGLFEGTSKKAKNQEEAERKTRERAEREKVRREKRVVKAARKKERLEGQTHEQPSGMKEVWIMPGCEKEEVERISKPTVQRTIEAKHGRYDKLSSAELTKELISVFIVVHGKLFTRIGIETVDQAVERLHQVFQALLTRGDPLYPESSMLIKMVVINIFSIHHVADAYKDNDTGYQYYCSLGFRLAQNFTRALLQSCTDLLPPATSCQGTAGRHLCSQPGGPKRGGEREPTRIAEEEVSGSCEDCRESRPITTVSPSLLRALDALSVLLPAIRIWFDWLVHQQTLWLQFLPRVEFWMAAAKFLNKCSAVFRELLETSPFDPATSCHRLWEDRELAGFMPLTKAAQRREDTFTIKDASQLSPEDHREQCLKRLVLLARDLQALSPGSQVPVTYDEVSKGFSVEEVPSDTRNTPEIVPSMAGDHGLAGRGRIEAVIDSEVESEGSSDDVVVEEEEEEEEATMERHTQSDEASSLTEDLTTDRIAQLKAQKELLTRQIVQQRQAMETAQAVLEEAVLRGSKVIRVTPKYLVPDTNCFVSMLPSVQTLVRSGHFTVAVPLTVLTELEGLGKESGNSSSGKGSIGSGAKSALEYVTDEFSSHNCHVRALTTQGSLLPSLSFRAEVTEKASNDDLILESCLNLHHKVDQARLSAGEVVEAVQCHSVVLLTADRNLRVKAHATGLPVKDLPTFLRLIRSRKS